MAAVTVRSDFGARENKIHRCFHCLPICCHDFWVFLKQVTIIKRWEVLRKVIKYGSEINVSHIFSIVDPGLLEPDIWGEKSGRRLQRKSVIKYSREKLRNWK